MHAGPSNSSILGEAFRCSEEDGRAIDLNAITTPLHNDLEGGGQVNTDGECPQAAMLEEVVSQGPLTQDSDPFNLGPLICNMQRRAVHGGQFRGKRGRNELEEIMVDKRIRRRISLTLDDGGGEGVNPNQSFIVTNHLEQVEETSLNGSPRALGGLLFGTVWVLGVL